MRNSLHLVSGKDRTHVAAALKAIYRAVDEQAAALEDFEAAWAARYPGIPRMWRDACK
jgi:transposase-like protein